MKVCASHRRAAVSARLVKLHFSSQGFAMSLINALSERVVQ